MIEHDLGLLADNAHVDASGKLYILGEFRYIFAQNVPARHPHFSVVSRWTADLADTPNHLANLEVQLVNEDGAPIMPRSPKIPIRFAPIGPAARGRVQAQLVLSMDGIVLPAYGDYAIHFFVNDVSNGKVSFHVAPIPAPPVTPDAGR